MDDGSGEKVKITNDPPLCEAPDTEEEPLYGKHYLPRKFKIVVAVPPSNDVDIYAHDLGYIAVVKDKRGRLVEGDLTDTINVTDLWTFARNLKDKDPNWTLVATQAG